MTCAEGSILLSFVLLIEGTVGALLLLACILGVIGCLGYLVWEVQGAFLSVILSIAAVGLSHPMGGDAALAIVAVICFGVAAVGTLLAIPIQLIRRRYTSLLILLGFTFGFLAIFYIRSVSMSICYMDHDTTEPEIRWEQLTTETS